MKSLRFWMAVSFIVCGLSLFVMAMPAVANDDRCMVEPVPCVTDNDCEIAGFNCSCGTLGFCVSGYPYPH